MDFQKYNFLGEEKYSLNVYYKRRKEKLRRGL